MVPGKQITCALTSGSEIKTKNIKILLSPPSPPPCPSSCVIGLFWTPGRILRKIGGLFDLSRGIISESFRLVRKESPASWLTFFTFLEDNMFRVGRWFDKVDRNHNPQNVRRASGHLVVLLVIREYLQTTRECGGGGGSGDTKSNIIRAGLGWAQFELCGDVSFNYLGELVAGA